MNVLKRKELLIGVLVLVALLILFFGINFLKGVNLFKASNYYYATYNDVAGLATSAPVTLNGYKVGVVRGIDYDYSRPGNVTVEISVDKELKLPKGSTATVNVDILGTATIVLRLDNPANGFYQVGDTIASNTDKGMLASLSEGLLPSVGSIMTKVDTLLSSLNTIAANPSLAKSLNRMDDITLELNQSLQALHKVIAQLGPVTKDVKSITCNVDTITADLAKVSGTLSEAPVDSIMSNLDATIANLHALTDELNNPNSTIGKLTKDPALYNSLNSTVSSLDSLFVDIKRNPKRYVTIKIF